MHRRRREPYVDAFEPTNASSRYDGGRRGRNARATGQDCESKQDPLHLLRSSFADRQQYFKSIEKVASGEGFGQILPSKAKIESKRDSVIEQLDSPKSPTSKSFLAPSKPELTRSVTPDLIPDSMHNRLPDEPAKGLGLDGLAPVDLPLSSMHERVDSPTL